MGRLKGSRNGVLTLIEKTCESCESVYTVEPHRLNSSRFCSKPCKDEGHAKNMKQPTIRLCEECKSTFVTSPRDKKRFCSFDCSLKYVHRVRKTRWIPRNIGTCPMCESEFEYLPKKKRAGRKSDRQIYCSVKCADEAKILPPVEKICPACKSPYATKRTNQVFCSNDCKLLSLGSDRPASDIEILMREALLKQGLNYVEQMPIGCYRVDFAIPSTKIAIECDGEYWHSFPEAKNRDARKDKFLASIGWKVIRFPGSVIKNDVDACLNSIIKEAA